MKSFTWAVIILAGLSCVSGLGNPIDIQDHPSVVQVEFFLYYYWYVNCGASLISSFYIITAANCLAVNHEYRRVRAGSHVNNAGGIVVQLDNVITHPDYDFRTSESNVAVAKLRNFLSPSPSIQPVAIAPQNYFLIPEQNVKLVSWGSTAAGASKGVLHSLDLVVWSNINCGDIYAEQVNNFEVKPSMFCAGVNSSQGRDYDQGDIGSPIVFQNALVGILNYGKLGADDAVPVVATSVGSFSDWIVENARN